MKSWIMKNKWKEKVFVQDFIILPFLPKSTVSYSTKKHILNLVDLLFAIAPSIANRSSFFISFIFICFIFSFISLFHSQFEKKNISWNPYLVWMKMKRWNEWRNEIDFLEKKKWKNEMNENGKRCSFEIVLEKWKEKRVKEMK